LYDRPGELFRPISLSEQHELFLKLAKDFPEFSSSRPDDTLLTERFADDQVRSREDRPGLVISSTSWTEDEDFSVLLEALDGITTSYNVQLTLMIRPILIYQSTSSTDQLTAQIIHHCSASLQGKVH